VESKSSIWDQAEIVRLLSGRPGTQYQESDEVNQAIIRDWVRRLLQTTEVEVEFVKSDGALRVMRCTLHPEHLPASPVNVPVSVDGIVKESRSARKLPDPHSIRVFDLDQQAWRSFRFDRLRRVSASLTFA
jgi:hypothetical protein